MGDQTQDCVTQGWYEPCRQNLLRLIVNTQFKQIMSDVLVDQLVLALHNVDKLVRPLHSVCLFVPRTMVPVYPLTILISLSLCLAVPCTLLVRLSMRMSIPLLHVDQLVCMSLAPC